MGVVMGESGSDLLVEDWGLVDYQLAFDRQSEMVRQRLAGQGRDTLILVEHPATVTLGRRGGEADLRLPEKSFPERGVVLQQVNRGGLATAHEPGQLVVYPILRLKRKNLHWYADTFLNAVIALLAEYGLQGNLKPGEPGVWVDGRKICSFGIALKRWVSSHGIALNVNNNLQTFEAIVPCGQPGEIVTSMARELGHPLDFSLLKESFLRQFAVAFDYRLTQ